MLTLKEIQMNVLEFTAVVAIVSFVAGLLGSLTGLGGGVVLVPLLTIFFHVDIRYAIGASLVSVIATSSGAAASYVKEGFSNIRIGMFLEIANTIGALLGAFLATRIPTNALAIIFGAVLLYSAYLSRTRHSLSALLAPRTPRASARLLTGNPLPGKAQTKHPPRVLKGGFFVLGPEDPQQGLWGEILTPAAPAPARRPRLFQPQPWRDR